ncbi:MAG: hypothetical protein D6731_19900 [Planctomycetota bacterium]|nr:MAG: hypothetical protein D6731_19900 [Planctomycetota bacterium]
MNDPCPGCGASGTSPICGYCGRAGAGTVDPARQRKALDAFHALLAREEDVLARARLLRNGFLPDDPEVLLDAAARCVALLDQQLIATGAPEAAADRLRAALRRLEAAGSPPSARAPFEAELERFDVALAADERRTRWVCAGCAVILFGGFGLALWRWWTY